MTGRRDFLRHSAAMVASAAVPGFVKAADATATGWYDRPMRWAQLTLVEDDPGKYDPQFWLQVPRRSRLLR